jgi:hypothetical protein
MKAIITFFSQSTFAATHFAALRVILHINKGLEKVGKTRFGTIYWSSYSLLRCLDAIRTLVDLGIIKTEGSEVK